MYGAILGDIIGQPYEFDCGNKTKEFPLFSKNPRFTDDTVMTVAICSAILKAGIDADEVSMKTAMITSMQLWGHKYPHAGYGRRFYCWLAMENTEPYNSWGNGSAMRVSSIGWLFDSLERTREVARWSAEVTHNHPEGVKGAEAPAAVIWLARNGYSKEDIKSYVIKEFGYDLSRTCDEIRPDYRHVESCQETVPEAITAFLEGESFEDVVRTAVSLGGDCDTLTDIAAAMAEAYYGIPDDIYMKCMEYTTYDMHLVMKRFDMERIPSKKSEEEDKYNLDRFKRAQALKYPQALKELKAGKKETHWIWYVFPQIHGLGYSDPSRFYGISSMEEAKEYLKDKLLRERLIEISEVLLELESDSAPDVMGSPDDIKLKSSMTLFLEAEPDNETFRKVLDKFFDGEKDSETLRILEEDSKPKNYKYIL